MFFNEIETKASYSFPVSKGYYSYLQKRKIISTGYLNALQNNSVGILTENLLMIQDSPFCVNCILGKSTDSIFDLKKTNALYGISPKDGTAFAVLYGDDYLFFKQNDEAVYCFRRDAEEIIKVAEDYDSFIGLINII